MVQFNFEDLGKVDYRECWDLQEEILEKTVQDRIQKGVPSGKNSFLLVEHPHVYTLGKSGNPGNILIPDEFLKKIGATFYRINRGGDITYHGPGQIVGYPVFDLEVLKVGLREYISRLEEAIILTLKEYGLAGSRFSGGTGVWLDPDVKGRARKICAIGVKASRFVTMHGFAFNVNTDLTYFDNINPCGFTDKGVTSLSKELCEIQDINLVKRLVKKNLTQVFDLEWINQ